MERLVSVKWRWFKNLSPNCRSAAVSERLTAHIGVRTPANTRQHAAEDPVRGIGQHLAITKPPHTTAGTAEEQRRNGAVKADSKHFGILAELGVYLAAPGNGKCCSSGRTSRPTSGVSTRRGPRRQTLH